MIQSLLCIPCPLLKMTTDSKLAVAENVTDCKLWHCHPAHINSQDLKVVVILQMISKNYRIRIMHVEPVNVESSRDWHFLDTSNERRELRKQFTWTLLKGLRFIFRSLSLCVHFSGWSFKIQSSWIFAYATGPPSFIMTLSNIGTHEHREQYRFSVFFDGIKTTFRRPQRIYGLRYGL